MGIKRLVSVWTLAGLTGFLALAVNPMRLEAQPAVEYVPSDVITGNSVNRSCPATCKEPYSNPIIKKCCECYPCVTPPPTIAAPASATFHPDWAKCVADKAVGHCGGCQADADCPDPVANDCKGRKCDVANGGVCVDTVIPNCPPPPSNACADKYPGDGDAINCCEAGLDPGMTPDKWKCCKAHFSETTDPAAHKCCMDHVTHGEDPGTAENPIPCKPGECPRCPDCPKINCDLVKNEDLKKCCKEEKGYLYFMMKNKECFPDKPTPAACKDFFNVVAGGDVTINIECSNICCNNCSAVGDSSFASCHQDCMVDCSGGPGGGTTGGVTGGTPTTPSGSATALTCSVALVGEPVEGKFEISYTVPASAGPVVSATLTQVSGSQIRVEGEAEPADFGATVTEAKSMSTKSISDPNYPPPFTVYAPTPKSMAGEWRAPFEVKVSLNTLEGEAGSALCTESHFLHAEGTGCGCNMTSQLTPREQILAYAVLVLLLATPMAVLRRVRKRR